MWWRRGARAQLPDGCDSRPLTAKLGWYGAGGAFVEAAYSMFASEADCKADCKAASADVPADSKVSVQRFIVTLGECQNDPWVKCRREMLSVNKDSSDRNKCPATNTSDTDLTKTVAAGECLQIPGHCSEAAAVLAKSASGAD